METWFTCHQKKTRVLHQRIWTKPPSRDPISEHTADHPVCWEEGVREKPRKAALPRGWMEVFWGPRGTFLNRRCPDTWEHLTVSVLGGSPSLGWNIHNSTVSDITILRFKVFWIHTYHLLDCSQRLALPLTSSWSNYRLGKILGISTSWVLNERRDVDQRSGPQKAVERGSSWWERSFQLPESKICFYHLLGRWVELVTRPFSFLIQNGVEMMTVASPHRAVLGIQWVNVCEASRTILST